MKSYPVTIIDDFFENPDYIRDLGLSVDYPIQENKWPGRRSDNIQKLDCRLFDYFGSKLFTIFGTPPPMWNMQMNFQKISPYSNDKWDMRNRGWVHCDKSAIFGGVVYLNKNPDKDTGTSIYRQKKGISYTYQHETDMKCRLYGGEDVDTDDYTRVYEEYHDQYYETVKIENVYNRVILFGADVFHGVKTFGTEERLTISFFCLDAEPLTIPLLRN